MSEVSREYYSSYSVVDEDQLQFSDTLDGRAVSDEGHTSISMKSSLRSTSGSTAAPRAPKKPRSTLWTTSRWSSMRSAEQRSTDTMTSTSHQRVHCSTRRRAAQR